MTKHCWLAVASRFAVRRVSCVASRSVAGLLLGALLLGSCRRSSDGTSADASAPAALAATGATALAPDAGVFPAATRRACRVMALRGTATSRPRLGAPPAPSAGGGWGGGTFDAQPTSLGRSELLPEGGLIELESGASLTVQATVSTREITLVGPALAEACPGGEEAIRLSYGKVTAFPGGGVRPGAEVWVATPLGVVRFNDANLEVTVAGRDADRIEVALVTGHAIFVPAIGVSEVPGGAADAARAVPKPSLARPGSTRESDGSIEATEARTEEVTLAQGAAFAASRPDGPLPRWVRDLVGACVRLGAAAREAGRLVGMPESAPRSSLGERAFAHVRARQRARVACETAWAAGALAPGLLDARLRADLEGGLN